MAEAFVEAARTRGLAIAAAVSFAALEGRGLEAVGGRQAPSWSATAALLESSAAIDASGWPARADALAGEGKTPVFAAVDGRAAGLLAVADPIKEGAAAAVRTLKGLGLEVVMLTGDHRPDRRSRGPADRGRSRPGRSSCPAGKTAEIRRLQAEGQRVAMVGDGINDAPALAQADVGIAIGTGTDVAMEASDITLIGGDLSGVARAIALSRRTIRTIKQNLFWAFVYNVIGIPVAAGLLYPFFGILLNPMLASAAMAFSSVSVVSNSLRLRRYPPGPVKEAS